MEMVVATLKKSINSGLIQNSFKACGYNKESGRCDFNIVAGRCGLIEDISKDDFESVIAMLPSLSLKFREKGSITEEEMDTANIPTTVIEVGRLRASDKTLNRQRCVILTAWKHYFSFK